MMEILDKIKFFLLCLYFRDRYENPDSKRRRKEKSEKEKKGKFMTALTYTYVNVAASVLHDDNLKKNKKKLYTIVTDYKECNLEENMLLFHNL